MSYARIDRISQEVRRELSMLIPTLKDPRIPSMVSVTNVRVSKDLSYAEVNISVLGTEEQQKDAMKGLESSKSFLRREIARKVQLRATPELLFKLDDSISEGARICNLINSVKRDEE
ncbi:MAG: 30S ribosome-binding factor RbfA [Ruminococcaceae bacterium]|nr:30S ribosome-binding factor RbfA [Oscillospiraceae bacterium]